MPLRRHGARHRHRTDLHEIPHCSEQDGQEREKRGRSHRLSLQFLRSDRANQEGHEIPYFSVRGVRSAKRFFVPGSPVSPANSVVARDNQLTVPSSDETRVSFKENFSDDVISELPFVPSDNEHFNEEFARLLEWKASDYGPKFNYALRALRDALARCKQESSVAFYYSVLLSIVKEHRSLVQMVSIFMPCGWSHGYTDTKPLDVINVKSFRQHEEKEKERKPLKGKRISGIMCCNGSTHSPNSSVEIDVPFLVLTIKTPSGTILQVDEVLKQNPAGNDDVGKIALV